MSLSYAPTDWEELYPLDWALAPLLKPKGPIRPPRSLAPRQDAASPFQNLDSSLDWTVKTHIVPAAWPRTRQRSAQNRTLPFPLSIHTLGRSGRGSTREEARWLEQHNRPPLVDLSSPYAYEDQEQLWIAVNRYAPKQARTGGYTLVLAHAGGFHKESFEVMLARLLASPSGQRVDEVYSYDCSNNGDSAVLNRDLLGDTHSWIDHGRDAANFLISYLPPKNAREQPTLLPEQQVDPDLLQLDWREEKKPLHGSWRGHSLVAIGQSYGGAALTLAEVACPGLFSGASFLDAMLVHPIPEEHLDVASMFRANAAGGCLARRDHWPNRDIAYESLRKNAGLGSWSDDVLRGYVTHALVDVEGGVELKCRKADEALLFIENSKSLPAAAMRLNEFSSDLGARTHYILAKQSWVLDDHQEKNQAATKGATVERVDSAHLVTQENPDAVARSLAGFLDRLGPVTGQAKL